MFILFILGIALAAITVKWWRLTRMLLVNTSGERAYAHSAVGVAEWALKALQSLGILAFMASLISGEMGSAQGLCTGLILVATPLHLKWSGQNFATTISALCLISTASMVTLLLASSL